MGISVYIQNQVHEKLNMVDEISSRGLVDLIEKMPKGALLEGIHYYADTMFNSYQLEFFLSELSAITPENEQEASVIAALRSAAEVAIRRNGYLWFSGD